MSYKSKVYVLKSIPQGAPRLDDFDLKDREISVADITDGQVIVKLEYVSVDPYLVGKLRGTSTYTAAFKVNEPIVSRGLGHIVESKSASFKPGDQVTGFFEWANYSVAKDTDVKKGLPGVPAEDQLSILGSTGLTAYFGLFELCNPKEGETVLVSGAAGAVGTAVGQLAKIRGCKVIGIAGSDDKINYITKELGFDHGINYKTENLKEAIAKACPNGIDVYFDNVGGETLDIAIRNMNNFGRVSICGAISQYTKTEVPQGPRLESQILMKRLKVQGFIVSDFASKFPVAITELLQYYKSGKLKGRTSLTNGIENLPTALIGLLSGENIGKALVKL